MTFTATALLRARIGELAQEEVEVREQHRKKAAQVRALIGASARRGRH